ncbi:MAG TPA: hypothetical protein VJ917_09205 [Saprospiraceae bacterium]|nr:hypothetical protein [Saprospiraceae bacterium]
MTKNLLLLTLLALSMTLVSCSDDDDDGGNSSAYVGTWTSTSVRSFDCNSMEDAFETETDGCFTVDPMLMLQVCFTINLEIRDDMTGTQTTTIESPVGNTEETSSFTYVEKPGNILEICEDGTPDDCVERRYRFNGNDEMIVEQITPDPDTGCLSEINLERQ